jgi:hypothetical protein
MKLGFGVVMILALTALTGCLSSSGGGGGSKPSTTYIVVPAGQPLPQGATAVPAQ